MRKWRLKEVKWFVQGHVASKNENVNLNLGLFHCVLRTWKMIVSTEKLRHKETINDSHFFQKSTTASSEWTRQGRSLSPEFKLGLPVSISSRCRRREMVCWWTSGRNRELSPMVGFWNPQVTLQTPKASIGAALQTEGAARIIEGKRTDRSPIKKKDSSRIEGRRWGQPWGWGGGGEETSVLEHQLTNKK